MCKIFKFKGWPSAYLLTSWQREMLGENPKMNGNDSGALFLPVHQFFPFTLGIGPGCSVCGRLQVSSVLCWSISVIHVLLLGTDFLHSLYMCSEY